MINIAYAIINVRGTRKSKQLRIAKCRDTANLGHKTQNDDQKQNRNTEN